MVSYDEIVSNKSSLEFEINTYRRLLESEEAHVKKVPSSSSSSSSAIRQSTTTITNLNRPTEYSPPTIKSTPIIPDTKINQTEMQAKTTFQRSAKGFFFFFFFFL